MWTAGSFGASRRSMSSAATLMPSGAAPLVHLASPFRMTATRRADLSLGLDQTHPRLVCGTTAWQVGNASTVLGLPSPDSARMEPTHGS